MLKIRDEHLRALALQQRTCFIGRMAGHLRETFSADVSALDNERLRKFVEKVCSTAEQWGITEETHVERLLELYVSFDQLRRNPLPEGINAIVSDRRYCGEQILLMLEDRLLFEDRT
ncbi:MAG: hypothetical protein JWP63_2714 [Candidatus Solibacter sp.]|nr:hypothetical protein [Candidatus Solibacter sp.]